MKETQTGQHHALKTISFTESGIFSASAKKSGGEPASVRAVVRCTHIQKQLIKLNSFAQLQSDILGTVILSAETGLEWRLEKRA